MPLDLFVFAPAALLCASRSKYTGRGCGVPNLVQRTMIGFALCAVWVHVARTARTDKQPPGVVFSGVKNSATGRRHDSPSRFAQNLPVGFAVVFCHVLPARSRQRAIPLRLLLEPAGPQRSILPRHGQRQLLRRIRRRVQDDHEPHCHTETEMSSGGDMTDPVNDLNDAYAVIPTSAELRGPPPDWWAVTANCVPVWHFAPDANHSSVRRRSGGGGPGGGE